MGHEISTSQMSQMQHDATDEKTQKYRLRKKGKVLLIVLDGTVLENVERLKYSGIAFTNNLTWNTHITNVGLR